jgi:hypothetical protein
MEAATEQVACTIVSVEEVLRGWLAIIHRLRGVHRQLPAYDRLGQLFTVLSDWEIVPFDKRAADQFTILRRQHIRIGTMDLKIAAIALVRACWMERSDCTIGLKRNNNTNEPYRSKCKVRLPALDQRTGLANKLSGSIRVSRNRRQCRARAEIICPEFYIPRSPSPAVQ